MYFNLFIKYPDDICYLSSTLPKTLLVSLINDITFNKPKITITPQFAIYFVKELLYQISYVESVENQVKINSFLFQKLVEKNPQVIKYFDHSIPILSTDLCSISNTEEAITNFFV